MHLRLAIFSFALLFAHVAARAAEPNVALPPSCVTYPAGDHVVLNGVPMRMLGFSSKESPKTLVTWFTKNLGNPLTVDTFGRSMILGKSEGDYHVTVKLDSSGDGVQGVVAIANLKAAGKQHAAYHEQLDRWLLAWPDGSKVLSDMTSEEQGKSSRYVVVRNFQTATINVNRLTAILKRDGYQLEREVAADSSAVASRGPSVDGRTLYFRGEGKEAMATISRDEQGNTVTVLNTISTLGQLQ
jgi:hypothetical protein